MPTVTPMAMPAMADDAARASAPPPRPSLTSGEGAAPPTRHALFPPPPCGEVGEQALCAPQGQRALRGQRAPRAGWDQARHPQPVEATEPGTPGCASGSDRQAPEADGTEIGRSEGEASRDASPPSGERPEEASVLAQDRDALTPAALHRLLTWTSPAFPVGAYTCSHGLEWAVEAGAVRDAAGLRAWLADVVLHGAGRSDAVLFAAVHRAVSARNWPAVAEAAELALALQPSAERRLEATIQGRAFLTAVESVWPSPVLGRFREVWSDEIAFPVAFALAAAAHALPLAPALRGFLHAFAANLVSAGVRLVPLGQTAGLEVLAELEPVAERALAEALVSSLDDVGGAVLLADIASMRHETQYTRLFRT